MEAEQVDVAMIERRNAHIILLVLVFMIAIYPLDLSVVRFLQDIRTSPLNIFFLYFTMLGNYVFALGEIIFVLLYRGKDRKKYSIAVIASLLSWCITDRIVISIKMLTRRPRPFLADNSIEPLCGRPQDYSFPSGHSNAAWSLTTPLVLCTRSRTMKIILIAFAILMSFSRIYCGVHYPTDVIFGALIGYLASFYITGLLVKIVYGGDMTE